jgi:hypothetical protein
VPFRTILLQLPDADERTALRGNAQPGMSGSPLVNVKDEVVGMLLAEGGRGRLRLTRAGEQVELSGQHACHHGAGAMAMGNGELGRCARAIARIGTGSSTRFDADRLHLGRY